jgi:DNA-binding transcriptional ArsR family regulator
MELLRHLVVTGPATATELAEALADSPSNCSWHLRKLAEHGFVEEVPDSPGRARPWRAVTTGLSWDDGDEESEFGAASRDLSEALLAREVERLRASRAAAGHQAEEWRRAGCFTQAATWLTAEEATELSGRITELLLSYSERLEDPTSRPDGARLVSLVGWLAPRPAADEGSGS